MVPLMEHSTWNMLLLCPQDYAIETALYAPVHPRR
jgi:hypothetical protein